MKRKFFSLLLLAGAFILIFLGIMQGDFQDTLHKASLICLECIGIG